MGRSQVTKMFIPDMLFSVISSKKAVVMFPDRQGLAYLFGSDVEFDPLTYPTWKVALKKVHELGVKPAAQLYEDPDSGEIGWVVLDTTLNTKERTGLKKAVMKLTTLSLDPEKVSEDREKVSVMRYFVGKNKFYQLYKQAEEITMLDNPKNITLLFEGIKEEIPLPDALLAEFAAKKAEVTLDVSSEEIPQETFESLPLFDVLTVEELQQYVADNNITTIPTNAKKIEVFIKHCKQFHEKQLVETTV